MKIRTCLLAAFGLVVPLLAMFSHLIPAGVSDSFWKLAWQPAAAFFEDSGGSSTTPDDVDGADSPAAEVHADLPDGTAALLPVDTAVAAMPVPGTTAGSGSLDTAELAGGKRVPSGDASVMLPTVDLSGDALSPLPTRQTSAWPTATVRRPPGDVELSEWPTDAGSPAAVIPAAMTRPIATAPSTDPATTAALEQLGAFDITCQPTAGGRFFHCSCRVAADPTGQLVRMFHTTETDPQRAMLRLMDDVRRWKDPIAAGPEGSPGAGGTLLPSREAR